MFDTISTHSDSVVITLLVLALIWSLKKAFKVLWLDRVPRHDYETADRWYQKYRKRHDESLIVVRNLEEELDKCKSSLPKKNTTSFARRATTSSKSRS